MEIEKIPPVNVVTEFVLVIKEIRRYLRLAGQEPGEAFIIFNIISYKKKALASYFLVGL